MNTTPTQLIIVEGIPGSGKSTLAGFIQEDLCSRQLATELFLEGDLLHPADFESVACMPASEYEALRNAYAEVFHLVDPFVTFHGDEALVAYQRAHLASPSEIPPSLYEAIRRYEIYDGVSAEKYCELTRSRWKAFADHQHRKDSIAIFECCFLQNPGCALLARHNAGSERFVQHVLEIAKSIERLNPILFYLKQPDVRETIERVKRTRSQEWLDFVICYHTEQEYGKAHGLRGFDGYVEFLERRRDLELQVIEQLPFETCVIDNRDYNWEMQKQISSRVLGETFMSVIR